MGANGFLKKRRARAGNNFARGLHEDADAGVGDPDQGDTIFNGAEEGQRQVDHRRGASAEPCIVHHIDKDITPLLHEPAGILRKNGLITEGRNQLSLPVEIVHHLAMIARGEGHDAGKELPEKGKAPLQGQILAEGHEDELAVFLSHRAVFVNKEHTAVIPGIVPAFRRRRAGQYEGLPRLLCQHRNIPARLGPAKIVKRKFRPDRPDLFPDERAGPRGS